MNGIESVWAVLKRGVYGVYHQISKKHLAKYVDEFTFRLNVGNVKYHTLERLDSFVLAVVGSFGLTNTLGAFGFHRKNSSLSRNSLPRFISFETIAHCFCYMPRKNWRDGVADLPLSLAQFRFKDEVVRERLEPRCLTHRDATWKSIVILNVAVALCANCVRRTVSDEASVSLFRTSVGSTPDVII